MNKTEKILDTLSPGPWNVAETTVIAGNGRIVARCGKQADAALLAESALLLEMLTDISAICKERKLFPGFVAHVKEVVARIHSQTQP